MLGCEMGWATLYREKIRIVTDYLTKPQYSNKQDSISYFVSYGLQMLTTSVSMVRFKSLGHVCANPYFKPTILAFLVTIFWQNPNTATNRRPSRFSKNMILEW